MKNLYTVAMLAAAIICEALELKAASLVYQLMFTTTCLLAGIYAAVVSLARPRPWAQAAADAMRAAPRLPGKAVGQSLALAAMGWWLMLAVYVAALALTYIAERKT